jgi:hypothetical protein
MSYYLSPTTQPRLHTLTRLADVDPWVAFREACEGGGTPPHWTQLGDDPEAWVAPSDAAGGLVLWCADGALWRVEPPRSDLEQIAAKALADLQDAAGAAWADWDGTYVPRAAYFSSGGRAVLLLDPVASGTWLVAVFRCEDTPRSGASEANITRLAAACVVEVMP